MERLFLGGDVMIGRGLDQAFRESVDPILHEPWVKDASVYLKLAEEKSGPVATPVEPGYPWGEALEVMDEMAVAARIANLETALTADGKPFSDKGIHYRSHPAHVDCLAAARLDACSLANNHVLDWGYHGFKDTLRTLEGTGIRFTGAGSDRAAALEPASIPRPNGGHIRVFGYSADDCGTPAKWAADTYQPGIARLADLSTTTASAVADKIRQASEPDDWIIVSIHWGGNWGYDVPEAHRRFARQLIDEAGVDLVHGHSSHHPKAVEVYRERLILYGCGDCLNDYEGISGHETFRPELVALWFPELDEQGRIHDLAVAPMQLRKLRLKRADEVDLYWMMERLNRVSEEFGAGFDSDDRGYLRLTPESFR